MNINKLLSTGLLLATLSLAGCDNSINAPWMEFTEVIPAGRVKVTKEYVATSTPSAIYVFGGKLKVPSGHVIHAGEAVTYVAPYWHKFSVKKAVELNPYLAANKLVRKASEQEVLPTQ